MNIITGYKGEPHITSQMDRNINRGLIGPDCYILNLEGTGRLNATIVSANEIRVEAGMLVAQGCLAEIPHGTTESLTIQNGAQGMRRWDLIVARYTRNTGTGVEDMSLVVKTGTPSSGAPSSPAYTTGSIVNGATLVEFPIFDVQIDGLTITSVHKRPQLVSNLMYFKQAVYDLNDAIAELPKMYTWDSATALESDIHGMPVKTTFFYVGTGSFATDLGMTTTTSDCFGYGYKAQEVVFFVTVCRAVLCYGTHKADGTNEIFRVLNLRSNI